MVENEPGLAAAEALRRVGRDAVFTIHTPVPAGNEVFDRTAVTRSLRPWFEAVRAEPAELLEVVDEHHVGPMLGESPIDQEILLLGADVREDAC